MRKALTNLVIFIYLPFCFYTFAGCSSTTILEDSRIKREIKRDTPHPSQTFFQPDNFEILVNSLHDVYLKSLLRRLNISVRVYIVKSLGTAAFSFRESTPSIVISRGFLELIRTSGELSFVLCHEAAHLGIVNGQSVREEVLADRVGLRCLIRGGFAPSESLSLLIRLRERNYFWDTPDSVGLVKRIESLREASEIISVPSYFPDRDYIAFVRRVLTSAQIH